MPNITLMHGDCLELMKQLPDGSVDMILCDLPYGTTSRNVALIARAKTSKRGLMKADVS